MLSHSQPPRGYPGRKTQLEIGGEARKTSRGEGRKDGLGGQRKEETEMEVRKGHKEKSGGKSESRKEF